MFAAIAAFAVTASAQVNLDFVNVGNAGNVADPLTGAGSVSYSYGISAYDVTLSQYCTFLNSTCSAGDQYGLYNSSYLAPSGTYSGIQQVNTSGVYSYSVVGNGNIPVFGVSWLNAARFTNWFTNGQGSGSTETGAYALNGASSGIFVANGSASYRLPTNNEWYKAAYYDPSLNAGAGGYWLYATQSNTAPGNNIANISLRNQANYTISGAATLPFLSDNFTSVGLFTGSPSAYGTYDQAGNIKNFSSTANLYGYQVLGTSYSSGVSELQANYNGSVFNSSDLYDFTTGIRLVDVIPEPSSIFLLIGSLPLYCLFFRFRNNYKPV